MPSFRASSFFTDARYVVSGRFEICIQTIVEPMPSPVMM